jgi:hypothetical protein
MARVIKGVAMSVRHMKVRIVSAIREECGEDTRLADQLVRKVVGLIDDANHRGDISDPGSSRLNSAPRIRLLG